MAHNEPTSMHARLEALREWLRGELAHALRPDEAAIIEPHLSTIEAVLSREGEQSRSQLRRIAAQKGELVPTFAPAGELTRAALSEKRLNEILAWMNGEPTSSEFFTAEELKWFGDMALAYRKLTGKEE